MAHRDHTGLRHTRQPALGHPKCMAALVAACVPAITAAEAVRCVGILFTNCFELSLGQAGPCPLPAGLAGQPRLPPLPAAHQPHPGSGGGGHCGHAAGRLPLHPPRSPAHHHIQHIHAGAFTAPAQRRCRCPRCGDPTEFGTNGRLSIQSAPIAPSRQPLGSYPQVQQ